MKYLKRFNEGVIDAYYFKDAIKQVKNLKDITLDELNKIFNPLDVEFVDVDYFISKLQTKKEIELVPVDMPPLMGGIRWGAHNVYTNKMYICIDKEKFITSIKNSNLQDQLLEFLEEVLRHESIHKSQAEKRPNKIIRNLENSPKEPKRYFSSTDETMAYADSFITQCRQKGLKDNEILDAIRKGKKVSWVQNVYSKMDKEVEDRFRKYVYQYLK